MITTKRINNRGTTVWSMWQKCYTSLIFDLEFDNILIVIRYVGDVVNNFLEKLNHKREKTRKFNVYNSNQNSTMNKPQPNKRLALVLFGYLVCLHCYGLLHLEIRKIYQERTFWACKSKAPEKNIRCKVPPTITNQRVVKTVYLPMLHCRMNHNSDRKKI